MCTVLCSNIFLLMRCAASNQGSYKYMRDVCHVNFSANYVELFRNISLATCALMCNQMFEQSCSGIFWNRQNGSCWLTSHTGEFQNDSDCDSLRSAIVFVRRQRVSCKFQVSATSNYF